MFSDPLLRRDKIRVLGVLIYNRIFARSRTPKCAKLVLGASAVHVRSRLCSRFFGVGPPKNEKKAILCEKGAYCELVSSLSSLDTASEREPAIRRVFFARQAMLSLPGNMRVHTRGLERPQLAGHGYLSPVPTTSSRRRRPRPRPLPLQRQHHALFARAPTRTEPGRGRRTQAEAGA